MQNVVGSLCIPYPNISNTSLMVKCHSNPQTNHLPKRQLKGQPIPSPVPLVLPPGIVCWEKDDVWACALYLAEVVAFIFAEADSGDSTSIITGTWQRGSAALSAFRERTRFKRPLLTLDCGRCALRPCRPLCNCRAFATGQDAAVLDGENAKWNQTALAARFGGAVPFDLKIDRSTDYRCKRLT